MRLKELLYCFIVSLLLFAWSCTKTEDDPANPYDGVDYSNHNTTTTPTEPDSNSIAGLQKNIFSKKCANPGCHDGTFEPDYRTLQSTYSTLVYQKVNKLTVNFVDTFTYRVIPNDTANSFLFERIITPTSDYMPSNGSRLSRTDINHIKAWIMNGARDEFGNLPVKPDLQPNLAGYIALDSAYQRIDSIRLNNIPYYPFLAIPNQNILIPVVVTDTADGASATLPANFTSVKIKFSTQKDNFNGAITSTCLFNFPIPGFDVWQGSVNTSHWTSGTTVYFRVYMNDGHHTTDAEFPRNESLDYYKTAYAFYVQ